MKDTIYQILQRQSLRILSCLLVLSLNTVAFAQDDEEIDDFAGLQAPKRKTVADKEEEGLFGLNQQEYDLDEFDNAGFAMEDEEFDPTEEVPIDV